MKNFRLALYFVVFMSFAVTSSAALYEAPPEIIPTLPKYCWGQYIADIPHDDPQFYISGCGEYANHYCPGLVNMKEADKENNLGRKMFLLSQAQGNMEYTLNNTKDIPECFLRPNAQAYLQRIKFQIDMLKLQMRTRSR